MTDAPASRPMRIGICAPYDLGRAGGVNSHIRSQAHALRQLGHDVCVFGASSAPLAAGEVALGTCLSLVVGGTETGIGVDPRSWRRVAGLFRTHPFDVLHVHEPFMPLVPWFVLRQATAPIVATFHTHREHGHRWYGPYRRLLDPLMRRVRTRLAVSDAARRTVARHFPGDYEIVPNGIELARFRQPSSRPSDMPADRRHVLCVGRLEPRKGVGRLIEAMATVEREVPDVRLVVVGDGPDRAQLEAAARAAEVDVLFTGHVSDEALPAYYLAADVVCSPALGDESFGIVLLEAMAAGRAIVATRIEGYAELLAGAGSARLVEADDPVALAREIKLLVEAPELRRTLGARGAAFARAYDWNEVARRLEVIYASTVGASRQEEMTTSG
jgi:phosphatidylinositol alpha-mannosyltransferase